MMYSLLLSQPAQEATALDFTVSIVACGPLHGGDGMVYAVGVAQPVQSWTVLRSHDDFFALSQTLPRHAHCPVLSDYVVTASVTPESIVCIRNTLQEWLTRILLEDPHARSSTPMRNFLTLGANTILPQYEGVAWTQFPNMAPQPTPVNFTKAPTEPVDDMEMDFMFFSNADDDGGRPGEIDDDHEHHDIDKIPSASERYKPTDEAVTDQDELDILQGDVEMVEDAGSLAQSMGASHLGRSLNLQAEMMNKNYLTKTGPQSKLTGTLGLNIKGSLLTPSVPETEQPQAVTGGIGGAMAQAESSNGAFKRRPMESAARLDSFKMIRVIGKGSFGKFRICFHSQSLCDMSWAPVI